MYLDHELSPVFKGRNLPQQVGDHDRPIHPHGSVEVVSSAPPDAFVFCVYIALRCSHCGELRQALAALPETGVVPCPLCGESSGFVPLGSGLTRRPLPFHEVQTGRETRWDRSIAETIDSS